MQELNIDLLLYVPKTGKQNDCLFTVLSECLHNYRQAIMYCTGQGKSKDSRLIINCPSILRLVYVYTEFVQSIDNTRTIHFHNII